MNIFFEFRTFLGIEHVREADLFRLNFSDSIEYIFFSNEIQLERFPNHPVEVLVMINETKLCGMALYPRTKTTITLECLAWLVPPPPDLISHFKIIRSEPKSKKPRKK